jgi:hypothetical protein
MKAQIEQTSASRHPPARSFSLMPAMCLPPIGRGRAALDNDCQVVLFAIQGGSKREHTWLARLFHQLLKRT